jgi:hypothetical protein
MASKPQPTQPQRDRRDIDPHDSPPANRSDILPDDLRRRDQPATPPDSPPPEKDGVPPTLAVDGGNPNHPVHDDDVEDLEPQDFEAEIDELDTAKDAPEFDRAQEIAPLLDRRR